MHGKSSPLLTGVPLYFHFGPGELKKMFDEAWVQVQADKEKLNDKQMDNADDDMFEATRVWALSQKKSV